MARETAKMKGDKKREGPKNKTEERGNLADFATAMLYAAGLPGVEKSSAHDLSSFFSSETQRCGKFRRKFLQEHTDPSLYGPFIFD